MDYYKITSQYFFSDSLGIILSIIAFIVGLKHYKEPKELRIITYYSGVAVAYDIIGTYFQLLNNLTVGIVGESILSVIEFIIFCIYLYRAISSHRMRAIIKFFYWTFPALLFFAWIKWKRLDMPTLAYVLDALYLIVPCLVYFYELFTTSKLLFLKNHPSFWIVTGILFYNSCTIPLFLLTGYFARKAPSYEHLISSLNYILYSILYLLFIRAYLCRTKAPSL
jgi:hypothetical protein